MRSDAFLELPPESQLLYVHLLVEADDDGFIRGKKYVLAMLGLKEDAFTALSRAGFLIVFATGSAAIAHWPLMNKVPKDRYTPTRCRTEMAQLETVEGIGYVLKEEITEPAEPTVSVPATEPLTDAVSPDIDTKTPAPAGQITEERSPQPAVQNKETESTGSILPSLPMTGGQSYAVPENDLTEWQRLYPNVNVLQELRAMRGWLLSRPEKQRTAPQTERFIHYWLSNAMRRAAQSPRTPYSDEPRRSRWADEGPPSYDMDRAMEKMMTTVPKLKKRSQ